MIHARRALLAHVRAFVEQELCGIVRFDELEHIAPMDAEAPPGRRTNPYGRHCEVVEVRFGNYDLAVKSPSEAPPLGSVELRYLGGIEDGPLDPATWKRLGAFIRSRREGEYV